MTYVPNLLFVSGSYPNQVIPSADINALLSNIAISRKPANDSSTLSNAFTTAPTAITQATSGAWQNITDGGVTYPSAFVNYVTDVNQNFLVHFSGQVTASATVANNLLFGVFVNNVQVGGIAYKLKAYATMPILVTFYKLIPAASLNNVNVAFKWQVELATPNVTFTMPSGFRTTGIMG